MTPQLNKEITLAVTPPSLINLLGVVYAHKKMSDEGDLYLTEYGFLYSDLLDIGNWFEKEWFESHRVRLSGTSAVYKVPTKEVNGQRLKLVVKNNRVGEDVPLDTHTLFEFMNAEFNSPWEEFSLAMDLRDSNFGPKDFKIDTQQPLAIYVPSEKLQLWQTGRSRSRINKIVLRHPSINLDILRQYKMVYKWIEGLNIVEAFKEIGISGQDIENQVRPLTAKVTHDLEAKGFIMADIKPSHIIISDKHVKQLNGMGRDGTVNAMDLQCEFLNNLIQENQYSVVDYELLMRTPEYDMKVKSQRRHTYLEDQRDRFQASALPQFLSQNEIFGVPYVHGHVESTGGMLWVVGRNPRLFDYFLPERWRKTPCHSFSENHEVYYTVTKDNIHIVWKTSRVGEIPHPGEGGKKHDLIVEYGFNSPFEEFAIAHYLSNNGIPTVYSRAIYMTGSTKTESTADLRHYGSHGKFSALDDYPILRENHEYIIIRGYFNGADSWVASHEGQLSRPFDLERAGYFGILDKGECQNVLEITRSRIKNVRYDADLLELNDVIISIDPDGRIIMDAENFPEARICNFELLHKLA
jgi:hypothetical protein